MYWAERSTPSVLPVDLEITNLMLAFRATAPAHSTSRSASPSSPAPRSPGSMPLTMNCGVLAGRPNWLRKLVMSDRAMWVRPTMAMLTPVPSVPAV